MFLSVSIPFLPVHLPGVEKKSKQAHTYGLIVTHYTGHKDKCPIQSPKVNWLTLLLAACTACSVEREREKEKERERERWILTPPDSVLICRFLPIPATEVSHDLCTAHHHSLNGQGAKEAIN